MTCDVLVIGAGVAGLTAALSLRSKGRTVTVIESRPPRRPGRAQPDWITLPGLKLLDQLGISKGKWTGEPFSAAAFHSAEFTKCAITKVPPDAVRVDYAGLIRELRQAAGKSGITCIETTNMPRLDAGERQVEACVGERDPVSAGFLLIADGAAGGSAGPAAGPHHWIAEAVFAAPAQSTDSMMHWALGPGRDRTLTSWWIERDAMVVHVFVQGSAEQARERLLETLRRAVEKRTLPAAAGEVKENAVAVRRAPAKSALEIESHVGKRSLVIGDAGGFVASASREGIYPAMWSATLAAEVLCRALAGGSPQDELRSFSGLWRSTMGEYLRPPNTDLQFLLPLVFTNAQMAERMAGAFWRGENI